VCVETGDIDHGEIKLDSYLKLSH